MTATDARRLFGKLNMKPVVRRPAASTPLSAVAKRSKSSKSSSVSLPSSSSITSSSAMVATGKTLNLRNYLNIVYVVDGLRYQFPSIGTDVYSGIVVDLIQRSVSRRTVGSNKRETDYLSTTGLIGSVDFDQLYESIDWKGISDLYLRPLFDLVSNNDSKRFDPRLKINGALRYFDKELTSVNSSVIERDRVATNVDQSKDQACPVDSLPVLALKTSKSLNSLTARCQKMLKNMRASYNTSNQRLTGMDDSVKFRRLNCNCCFFSPSVYVYCSLTDDAMNSVSDVNFNHELFVNMFCESNVPSVLFDVSSVLCNPISAERFDRDFKIVSVPPAGNSVTVGTTFVNLYKGCSTAEMGFMRNMFVLHAIVNVIVNWLWTRQRFMHEMLNGKMVTTFDLPPVTLYIARDVASLFDQVETVSWLSLRKARKVVVHVV